MNKDDNKTPAMRFFDQMRNLSPKTLGLTTALKAVTTKGFAPHILEIGAQRSTSKFSLFSDGWSSFVFAQAKNSSFISIDPALSVDNPVTSNLGFFDRTNYSAVSSCALSFIAAGQLSDFPDFIYLDGPDNREFTNDVLSYLIPMIMEQEKLVITVLDDLHTKVKDWESLKIWLMENGFFVRTVAHMFTIDGSLARGALPTECNLELSQAIIAWGKFPGGYSEVLRVFNAWEKAVTKNKLIRMGKGNAFML